MALPLSRVTRLEKFQRTAIEKTGPHDVVQYWGQVMPLIHLSKCLSDAETQSSRNDTDDSRTRHLGSGRFDDAIEKHRIGRQPHL